MKYIGVFFPVFLMLISIQSLASKKTDEYYYQTAVYREQIKSVQMYREGNELSNPVYELGSDVHLVLKFDDLADDAKDYSYSVVHCDANWTESYIRQNEYLDGLTDFPLTDYALSFNTTVKFVNYQVRIPNEDCNPKISGNYALVVFEDANREKVVLVQRFYVVEPLVRIEGLVKKATFDPFNGDNQEVDFKIYHERLRLMNPHDDLKVILMQNRRWDNAVKNLKPSFIRENQLDYDYDKENVFPGGNEFRYFDIRATRHNGENVNDIRFFDPCYHVTLMPDVVRSNKAYSPYKEMDGNYVVESQDRVTDNDTECDYVFVHFFLPMESPLIGGSVHVFGALTQWNVDKTNEMKWNFQMAGYELTMLLKQGYYNYQYVYVPEGSGKIDATNLEGTFFITENDYQILVYYRDQAGRYDRLVGFQNLNSAVKN